jgi:DNA recombination protein RmuC
MVIDAKVTLLAYDRYVAAEDDSQRAIALKAHVEAVRSHMKGLSEKNYQKLYALQSIDFVVMYMPVEPAFTLAAGHDETLFDEAWRKNVLIVTNSTLLFVIRTVAYLWNQEKQNRNAQEIAQRGAELYDKLVLFAEEMTAVGARLQQAQDSYAISMGRLSEGR